jgi:hypothetical protein
MSLTNEQFKDYLQADMPALWNTPAGSVAQARYRVQEHEFFTLVGAQAFLDGELKGKGKIEPIAPCRTCKIIRKPECETT